MRFALLVAPLALCVCVGVFGAPGGAAAYRQAGPSADSVAPCDISAYVTDKDPDGLNVRSGRCYCGSTSLFSFSFGR